jgi:hypothetical protein
MVSGGQFVPVAAGGTSSFSAVASVSAASGQSDRLNLYYEPFPTNVTYPKGQLVAAVPLPLVFLNSDGTERPVLASLQISATCTGGARCLTATVVGNFSRDGTQRRSIADLGVTVTLPPQSPSGTLHVQVPLLVTGPAGPSDAMTCQTALLGGQQDVLHSGNDPAYFGVVPGAATVDGNPSNPSPNIGSPTGVNQVSGLVTAFTQNADFPAAFQKGVPVGIAPYPAPSAVTGATTYNFGFCASFWGGNATTTTLNLAAQAFLSIGTDGTTYVTSPIPPKTGFTNPRLTCPSSF